MTTVLFVMRERALSCLALFGIGRAVLRFYRARIAPQRISRARHRSLGLGFSGYLRRRLAARGLSGASIESAGHRPPASLSGPMRIPVLRGMRMLRQFLPYACCYPSHAPALRETPVRAMSGL
jgi:hypothetical protein